MFERIFLSFKETSELVNSVYFDVIIKFIGVEDKKN